MKTFKITVTLLIAAVTVISCLCGCAADGGDTSADVTSAESAESVDGGESSESTPVPSESGSEVVDNETEDMPIISSGKYSGSVSVDSAVSSSPYIPCETGKVYYAPIRSQSPTDIDLYFPRDDALYAVYLKCCRYSKNIYDTQEYKDGEAKIEAEFLQNKIALAEKLFDCILNEYGDEGIDAIISDLNSYGGRCSISEASIYNGHKSYLFTDLAVDLDNYRKCGKSAFSANDYTVFCIGLLNYCLGRDGIDNSDIDVRYCRADSVYRKLSEAKGKDYLKWKDPLNDKLVALSQETIDKQEALWHSLYNSAAGLDGWYESLENSGAKIYEKTVYYVYNYSDDCDSELYDYLIERHSKPRVYKVAFLTKEQIKSIQLNGDEDYALRIVLVCDELATMENNTVYLEKEVVAYVD